MRHENPSARPAYTDLIQRDYVLLLLSIGTRLIGSAAEE